MIRALLFDLDGTLIQSERLKANAYALAAQQLLELPEPDARAIDAYREIVGATREAASEHVMRRLNLEPKLRPLMARYDVSAPASVLTAMRVAIYKEIISDPGQVRENVWPDAVSLLRSAREWRCRTALATSSHQDEVRLVLKALEIEPLLDIVLTADDVKNPKPNPEIYLSAAQLLDVEPAECLVLEDSPTGVSAGVNAGMSVIAIATPFTTGALHAADLLRHDMIVHRPEQLAETVLQFISEKNQRR